MSDNVLVIQGLHASVEGQEILKGIDLSVPRGEVHAIMGPNGSGKSTLANVLMGHPAYEVTRGRVFFEGEDVTGLGPDERAKLGVFLAFQYPIEVPGVSVLNFLRTAMGAVRGQEVPVKEFMPAVRETLKTLNMDESFVRRNLNEGFSGGEKKRNEVLQMALLAPKLAIMDETDSGLDIDAVRIVAEGVNAMRSAANAFVVITHYVRILNYLKPDVVHILMGGRIVKTGGPELADHLEEAGYETLRHELGVAEEAVKA